MKVETSRGGFKRWRRFGGGFKEVETFGEKKSRHTQGLVPGIKDAAHLEVVVKPKLPRIPILYQ